MVVDLNQRANTKPELTNWRLQRGPDSAKDYSSINISSKGLVDFSVAMPGQYVFEYYESIGTCTNAGYITYIYQGAEKTFRNYTIKIKGEDTISMRIAMEDIESQSGFYISHIRELKQIDDKEYFVVIFFNEIMWPDFKSKMYKISSHYPELHFTCHINTLLEDGRVLRDSLFIKNTWKKYN